MESIQTFLRLGACTVFVISLMYGLPACEKKEKPEQAEEKTQEMMEGSGAKMQETPDVMEEGSGAKKQEMEESQPKE